VGDLATSLPMPALLVRLSMDRANYGFLISIFVFATIDQGNGMLTGNTNAFSRSFFHVALTFNGLSRRMW
jgi:hypothetical protein